MTKEFKGNKESEKENNTLVNSNMTDNFTHLFNLLNKKDYPKLRIKIDEVLNLNIDNLSTKIYAKLIEIFLNLEENKLPSFVLLAPFGEVCENIKKLFTDCNQGSGESKNIKEDELKEFMRFGSELYKKFHDNLLSLNEDNLIAVHPRTGTEYNISLSKPVEVSYATELRFKSVKDDDSWFAFLDLDHKTKTELLTNKTGDLS